MSDRPRGRSWLYILKEFIVPAHRLAREVAAVWCLSHVHDLQEALKK